MTTREHANGLDAPWSGVRVVRHVPIPTRDGTILRADLYLPADGNGPWPVVLESLPYRKDDVSAPRWNVPVALAAHGIAAVRLDVRGTGSSSGLSQDEYAQDELHDTVDAIEWLASQPWCNGRVGMWGTSYGAFNALLTAMRRPPHLAAIVAHAGSDDRYGTDVHYWGGCLQAMELLAYPLWMIAMNALPPDPETPSIDWLGEWRHRLTCTEPWLFTWLRHQRCDDYWLGNSVKTDYGAIACPVFVVSAWHDGYTDAACRLLERLAVPVRGLIGPWTHQRPDASPVGPQIDFFGELLGWWQRWLLGHTDRGDGVGVRVYLQDAYRPARFVRSIPGHWYAVDRWPPPGVRSERWYGTSERVLVRHPSAGDEWLAFTNDIRVGSAGPSWCPTDPPDLLADDQRADDLFALTFESPPLSEPLLVMGAPELRATVAADEPVAFLCVRLSHVWPDGTVSLLTRGALNLTRARGFDRVDSLRPGEPIEVIVPLKTCAMIVPAGHRLRLALAGADFPTLWPAPGRGQQRVRVGGRYLELRLPVLADHGCLRPATYPEPRPLPVTAQTWTSNVFSEQFLDHLGQRVGFRRTLEQWTRPLGRQLEVYEESRVELSATIDRPEHCSASGAQVYRLAVPMGVAEARAELAVSSTRTAFHVTVELLATWNGRTISRRSWAETIRRDAL